MLHVLYEFAHALALLIGWFVVGVGTITMLMSIAGMLLGAAVLIYKKLT